MGGRLTVTAFFPFLYILCTDVRVKRKRFLFPRTLPWLLQGPAVGRPMGATHLLRPLGFI